MRTRTVQKIHRDRQSDDFFDFVMTDDGYDTLIAIPPNNAFQSLSIDENDEYEDDDDFDAVLISDYEVVDSEANLQDLSPAAVTNNVQNTTENNRNDDQLLLSTQTTNSNVEAANVISFENVELGLAETQPNNNNSNSNSNSSEQDVSIQTSTCTTTKSSISFSNQEDLSPPFANVKNRNDQGSMDNNTNNNYKEEANLLSDSILVNNNEETVIVNSLENMSVNHKAEQTPKSEPKQFEILPGLFATLCDDAAVGICDFFSHDSISDCCHIYDIFISSPQVGLAKKSPLFGSYISYLIGYDITLRAQIECYDETKNDKFANIIVRDLNLTINGGVHIEPTADIMEVVQFLKELSGNFNTNIGSQSSGTLPKDSTQNRRLTKEEWQSLLKNIKEDNRVNKAAEVTSDQVDFLVPNAKVQGFSLKLSNDDNPIDFPVCEGTTTCTVRTLLEYYVRSILSTIDARSNVEEKRASASAGGSNSVADIASVKASGIGAAVGTTVLGPLGFLAGTYLGGQLGRKHSDIIVGATAGACLFGPAGIIAGIAAANCADGVSGNKNFTSSSDRPSRDMTDNASASFGSQQTSITAENIESSAVDHVFNHKYEYAGNAGVVTGAAVGSVAGPIGMLTGAYIGSVSARKGTQVISEAATETRKLDGRRGYKFGDITRGLVTRGKKARGADQHDQYKFGDLTRGFFGSKGP